MRSLLRIFKLTNDKEDHIGLVSIRSDKESLKNTKNNSAEESEDSHRWLRLIRD